jgi:ribokinase
LTVELAVVGAPFLDITFGGLESAPRMGEEILATGLHIEPGGTGVQAIAAARLGLEVALVAPIGDDLPARFVRASLEAERVRVATGSRAEDVPVTAVLASGMGTAMVTHLAGTEPTAEEVAAVDPAAVLLSLGRRALAPAGADLYLVTGELELDSLTLEALGDVGAARCLILNESEAVTLTRAKDAVTAAEKLVGSVPTAIVTLGAGGALCATGAALTRVTAPEVEHPIATGAGDLFAAAFVWADRRGASPRLATEWATLYASHSVAYPSPLKGAMTRAELLAEGAHRKLTPPD